MSLKCDERKLLENPHPDFLKESPKTVDMFIRNAKEAHIKQFFMEDINALLEKYDPGKPEMKPEVLEQIKRIQAEREKMMREQQSQQGEQPQKLMINEPGKPPRELNVQEIMEIMNKQMQDIQQLREENQNLKQFIQQLHEENQNLKQFIQQQTQQQTNTENMIINI